MVTCLAVIVHIFVHICCEAYMHKVMYILGLVFGVFAGLITAFMCSPVYHLVMLWLRCFVLICMCDSAELPW